MHSRRNRGLNNLTFWRNNKLAKNKQYITQQKSITIWFIGYFHLQPLSKEPQALQVRVSENFHFLGKLFILTTHVSKAFKWLWVSSKIKSYVWSSRSPISSESFTWSSFNHWRHSSRYIVNSGFCPHLGGIWHASVLNSCPLKLPWN